MAQDITNPFGNPYTINKGQMYSLTLKTIRWPLSPRKGQLNDIYVQKYQYKDL